MTRLKGFKKLTPINEALRIFFGKLEPKRLEAVKVPTHEALGRVTAKDIIAELDLPPFNRSAVDGYAVNAKDTFEASQFKPKLLKLTENLEVHENEAKPVWTGTPLPKSADAVVMLEQTKKVNGNIEVWKAVTPGENVSKRGENVKKGEVAVKAGTRLKPQHLGLLAALGKTHISVVRKPKVAILPTGNELVKLGCKPERDQVIEVNSFILAGMCREIGAEPLQLGIAKDNLEELTAKIHEGTKKADVVVTTGGTSVGYADLVPQSINQIGTPGVVVHGIAMRPGMPTALAIVNDKPVLVLSGNPVAAIIGFEVFARPIIFRMLGIKNETRPIVKARLTRRVAGALGQRVFLRVQVFKRKSEFFAEPVRVKGAGVISTMTKANGYVIIPENRDGLEQDEQVTVHLFDAIKEE